MNRELSVSIHVRRGDYENLPEAKAMHGGICSLDYYHKAIDFIRQRLGSNICFYLFSDLPLQIGKDYQKHDVETIGISVCPVAEFASCHSEDQNVAHEKIV